MSGKRRHGIFKKCGGGYNFGKALADSAREVLFGLDRRKNTNKREPGDRRKK